MVSAGVISSRALRAWSSALASTSSASQTSSSSASTSTSTSTSVSVSVVCGVDSSAASSA